MINFLVLGLMTGAVYALYALGLVLVYRTTGVVNLAYGAMGMVGAFVFASTVAVVPPWPALVLVLVAAVLAGGLVGMLSLPVQGRSRLVKIAASIGLVTVLQQGVLVIWGTTPRPAPALATDIAFYAGDVAVTWQRVVAFALSVIMAALLGLAFTRGRVGAALQAVAESPDTAKLIGLPVRRLWVLAWAVAAASAVLGAVVVVPDVGLTASNLTFIILTPLAAALVARLTDPWQAVWVAVALGIAQSLLLSRPGLEPYGSVLPLAVVLVALVVRRDRVVWERV
jgi:branched-chain amino acid transport system permease protein